MKAKLDFGSCTVNQGGSLGEASHTQIISMTLMDMCYIIDGVKFAAISYLSAGVGVRIKASSLSARIAYPEASEMRVEFNNDTQGESNVRTATQTW